MTELELKEKELELKERELEIREKEVYNSLVIALLQYLASNFDNEENLLSRKGDDPIFKTMFINFIQTIYPEKQQGLKN